MNTIARMAQLLEDVFDVPRVRVEPEDNLKVDWGFDDAEMKIFRDEFRAEFNYAGEIELDTVTLDAFAQLLPSQQP